MIIIALNKKNKSTKTDAHITNIVVMKSFLSNCFVFQKFWRCLYHFIFKGINLWKISKKFTVIVFRVVIGVHATEIIKNTWYNEIPKKEDVQSCS